MDHLKNLFINDNNMIGISLGYKYINNIKTNTISVVYFVKNKLNINEIPENQVIPSTVSVDGKTYPTDVIETSEPISMSCYSSNDSNVTRLQTETFPLKGGQEIIQFPTNFSDDGLSYRFSTLGMMCVDNIDGKFVGLSCAHSVLNKFDMADNTNLITEFNNPYNLNDESLVFPSGTRSLLMRPNVIAWDKNVTWNGGGPLPNNKRICSYIKRYAPLLGGTVTPNYSIPSIPAWNQIDTAILAIKSAYIDINSHKIYTPIGTGEYSEIMDFATTAELDNILVTNPAVYSTGRTTGPKGYSAQCSMSITNINQYIIININGLYYPFNNVMTLRYNNFTTTPVAYGDSGSMVVGEFSGGVRKILGMIFGASTGLAYMCRIDDIVSQLNIRKWDWTSGIDPSLLNNKLSDPTPTFLKIETNNNTFNTVKSQPKITIGGKTYYQSGLTRKNYALYTG